MSLRLHSLLAISVLSLLLSPAARAQAIAEDGFANGPRIDLDGSTGGTGWSSAWLNAGTDPTGIGGLGLVYPGLASAPGAAVTSPVIGVYPASYYQRSYAVPASTTAIYVSFLLRADAGYGAWGGLSFGQYPYGMNVGVPPGMYAFGLLTSNGLGDITNRAVVQGQVVLLVVKIRRVLPGPGIVYDLFLDPIVGTGEPPFGDASYGIGQVPALPTTLVLDNGTGYTTDEIRVGTTWASVLPASSPWTDLGFAKPGVSGAPQLAGIGPLLPLTTCGIDLTNAAPTAPVVMGLGAQVANVPLLGGILVPSVSGMMMLGTDASGAASVQVTWPAGLPPGMQLVFQCWIVDAAATFGFAASNGLRGITP